MTNLGQATGAASFVPNTNPPRITFEVAESTVGLRDLIANQRFPRVQRAVEPE